jgi:hypothetical protein
MIMASCGQLQALESISGPAPATGKLRNPYLATLIKLLNAPRLDERCGTGTSP